MEDLKTPWELFGVECGEGWTKKNLPVFYSFFARKNLFVRSFNFF